MADHPRALAVLVNPAAADGRALEVLPAIEAELARLGGEFRVVHTTSAENAREEAAAAVAEGVAVAGVGGDGLIGTLAGELRGSEVPLAILPGGRGNDFARVLGIPTDPAKAARLAVEGDERVVDVADAGGRTYVGIASCGMDSDANRIANEAKLVKGNLVYLYAALRALVEWKYARFEVVVDGETHSLRGYAVAVANSKAYGGGMYAVPHAELDDGVLDVLLTSEMSKWACLKCVARSFDGSHVDNPALHFLRGREVEIRSDRPFAVYADGDPVADLPVKIRVVPRALRVIAPSG
jgi:YegS/Rv2252/BmrU family lipid kinase